MSGSKQSLAVSSGRSLGAWRGLYAKSRDVSRSAGMGSLDTKTGLSTQSQPTLRPSCVDASKCDAYLRARLRGGAGFGYKKLVEVAKEDCQPIPDTSATSEDESAISSTRHLMDKRDSDAANLLFFQAIDSGDLAALESMIDSVDVSSLQRSISVGLETYTETVLGAVLSSDISESEKINAVISLLDGGADVEEQTTLFIEHDALTRYGDYSGNIHVSPLSAALILGLPEVASLLLDRGAAPNSLGDFHWIDVFAAESYEKYSFHPSPLFFATLFEYGDVVDRLLAHEAMDISAEAESFWPPIHVASPKMTQKLLAYDHDTFINMTNWYGRTPLHVAVHKDWYDSAKMRLLLDEGADTSVQDNYNNVWLYNASDYHLKCATPLMYATENYMITADDYEALVLKTDEATMLHQERGLLRNVMHLGMSNGSLSVSSDSKLGILLKLGPNELIDQHDFRGRQPLVLAAKAWTLNDLSIDGLAQFISRSTDINKKSGGILAKTALEIVASKTHYGDTLDQVWAAFLEKGADVDVHRSGSILTSPLHNAMRSPFLSDEMKVRIVSASKDVNASEGSSRFSQTPLIIALNKNAFFSDEVPYFNQENHIGNAVLGAFLDQGAAVDYKSDSGDIPIVMAFEHSHLSSDILLRFVQASSQEKLSQADRNRVLRLAVDHPNVTPDIIAVLVEKGADPLDGAPSALESAISLGKGHVYRALKGTWPQTPFIEALDKQGSRLLGWNPEGETVVTYSLKVQPYFGLSGHEFSGFSDRQKEVVREIMAESEKMCRIKFVEVDSLEATLQFTQAPQSFFSDEIGVSSAAGFVFKQDHRQVVHILDSFSNDEFEPGGYGHFTLVHEFSHVLGMVHDKKGDVVVEGDSKSLTHDATTVSYSQGNHTGWECANPFGFQIYDIAFLQDVYGVREDAVEARAVIDGARSIRTNFEANVLDASKYADGPAVLDMREGPENVSLAGQRVLWNALGTNVVEAQCPGAKCLVYDNAGKTVLVGGKAQDQFVFGVDETVDGAETVVSQFDPQTDRIILDVHALDPNVVYPPEGPVSFPPEVAAFEVQNEGHSLQGLNLGISQIVQDGKSCTKLWIPTTNGMRTVIIDKNLLDSFEEDILGGDIDFSPFKDLLSAKGIDDCPSDEDGAKPINQYLLFGILGGLTLSLLLCYACNRHSNSSRESQLENCPSDVRMEEMESQSADQIDSSQGAVRAAGADNNAAAQSSDADGVDLAEVTVMEDTR